METALSLDDHRLKSSEDLTKANSNGKLGAGSGGPVLVHKIKKLGTKTSLNKYVSSQVLRQPQGRN